MFNPYKPSKEKSDKTKKSLRDLFKKTVENPGGYELIYTYNMVEKNYIIFKRTIFSNYIFGYDKNYEKFVVVSFSGDNNEFYTGEEEYFTKDDIISFKKNMLGKHTLKLKNGNSYKFLIGAYVTNLGGYTLPIIQEDEAKNLIKAIKNL